MSGLMATIARSKAFGGLLCDPFKMGEDRVVSYQQVGEGESERSLLITDRRER